MLTLLLALSLQAATAIAPAPSLEGDWVVDLSVKATQPYLKGMSLRLAPDGRVTGGFYDSEIQAGRWRAAADRTCASFRTTDGRGPYHTSVCLGPNGLEGQTWAEHRDFVFVWRGQRATEADRKAPWW